MANTDNHLNFTKTSIENLPLPEKGWKYYYDTKVAGLSVGVGVSGIKTYVLYRKINRKPERIKIGRVTDLTVDEARRQAERLNGAVANRSNPADDKRQQRDSLTFAEMFEHYYTEHSLPSKKSHLEDLAKFKKYLSDRAYGINLAKQRLTDLSTSDIKLVFNTISKSHPTTANRVLALISSIFTKAIEAEFYAGLNPCRGIKRNPEQSRERFITPDEAPKFFESLKLCPNPVVRDYIWISLLTGARRTNLLEMRWKDIHLVRREWVIPVTKNGTAHRVPLVKKALEILETRKATQTSEFVFPSTGRTGHLTEPKKAWKSILKRAEMEDLRIHDLRRTFGAYLAGSGANMSVIAQSLNHKSLATTKVYDRLWDGAKRDSMQVSTDQMLAFADGATP